MHNSLEQPWWLTIVIVTVVIRPIITLPLSLYQQVIVLRTADMKKEFVKWQSTLKYHSALKSTKNKWNYQKYTEDLSKQVIY